MVSGALTGGGVLSARFEFKSFFQLIEPVQYLLLLRL